MTHPSPLGKRLVGVQQVEDVADGAGNVID